MLSTLSAGSKYLVVVIVHSMATFLVTYLESCQLPLWILSQYFWSLQVTGDDSIMLHSYKVQSTITSRLANTMVQAKVENRARHSQNLVFDVQIPKGAFIHNFTM